VHDFCNDCTVSVIVQLTRLCSIVKYCLITTKEKELNHVSQTDTGVHPNSPMSIYLRLALTQSQTTASIGNVADILRTDGSYKPTSTL